MVLKKLNLKSVKPKTKNQIIQRRLKKNKNEIAQNERFSENVVIARPFVYLK